MLFIYVYCNSRRKGERSVFKRDVFWAYRAKLNNRYILSRYYCDICLSLSIQVYFVRYMYIYIDIYNVLCVIVNSTLKLVKIKKK